MDALKKLLKITPEQMQEVEEAAYNMDRQINAGRMDAVIHFGKLASGDYSPEELAEIQENILMDEACDKDYMNGYATAWQVLYNLARGVAADEVGYILP